MWHTTTDTERHNSRIVLYIKGFFGQTETTPDNSLVPSCGTTSLSQHSKCTERKALSTKSGWRAFAGEPANYWYKIGIPPGPANRIPICPSSPWKSAQPPPAAWIMKRLGGGGWQFWRRPMARSTGWLEEVNAAEGKKRRTWKRRGLRFTMICGTNAALRSQAGRALIGESNCTLWTATLLPTRRYRSSPPRQGQGR